ncbi:DNA-directed DNA polymerase alpha catalytic subunit pol1 [Rhizina undulata]
MSQPKRSLRERKKPNPNEGLFEELRDLRKTKRTRLHKYVVEKQEDVYDELDENEYAAMCQEELDNDFVQHDGHKKGEGYVNKGGDYWGQDDQVWDESDDDGREKLGAKDKKRKREEEQKRKAEQEGNISKYFTSANVVPSVKSKTTLTTEEDKDFMNSLLVQYDIPSTTISTSSKNKRTKEEPPRKARRLSPLIRDFKSKPPRTIASKSFVKFEVPSSPPPITASKRFEDGDDDDDEYGPPIELDDDVLMNDAPMPPSSPVLGAVRRKQKAAADMDDEDDDLVVMEVRGHKNVKAEAINFSASRPSLNIESAPSRPSAPAREVEVDSSAWTTVTGNLNVTDEPLQETAAFGKLSRANVVDEDGSFKFFWLDFVEAAGSLCLFGKVQDKGSGKWVSAFVKVDGIMRNLFFLPREYKMRKGSETKEEVEMSDVHEEVTTLLERHRIDSFKAKSSTRKYAFELPGIPREGDYLKVLYPYTKPALPAMETDNFETFSHIFGATTNIFEQFVLCRDIMGPGWLKIENADFSALTNASWCKLEVQVDKPQQIKPISDSDSSEPPPLTLMSIALRTSFNVKGSKQEIIAISCRIYENFSLNDTTSPEKLPCQTFTVVRPVDQVFPLGFEKAKEKHRGNIRAEKSESMLLSTFLAKLQIVDPDVFIGHALDNVDYGILLHRMRERQTPMWHRIGRMRRGAWPSSGGRLGGSFFADRQLASGRLMCDLANDLGKSVMTQCQSWGLTEMCNLILGEKRQELNNEEVLKTWAKSGKGFLDYLLHCEADTYFIAAIALKIQMLPLTKQLTNLAGNSWARTLSGTRAERNEYILLHEFYRNKYLCPDKYSKTASVPAAKKDGDDPNDEEAPSKKKEKYKGGLVFDPEKGLYDKFILVMDFNSLYPSIIQEYNICFTTVERRQLVDGKVPEVPEEQKLGILPKLISTLVNRRKQVKGLMKDKNATAVQKAQWDIKQQALKLTANSMYGCLGYEKSRFFAKPLAELTTYKGREILQATKDLATSLQLRVVYGDTDSVMINTNVDNYAEAIKIGNEFKKAVNDRYRLMEIDIDNVFERLLLHAKKKYAAVNYVEINGKLERKMEVKGLDMKRREYCQLSKDASGHILNEIFSGDPTEVVVERIHEYLRDLAQKVRENKFPAMKYIVYTRLGKTPEGYGDLGNTMPQVQVALRKRERGEPVKIGDVISYIITGDSKTGEEKNVALRAYSAQDFMKPDSGLKPDAEWYLIKQIFPPIERLCGPIDGTDAMRLADCLGLDTRRYQIVNPASMTDKEIQPLASTIPDEERFKDAAKLSLRCRHCKESFEFQGLILSRDRCSAEGIRCANARCGKVLSVVSVIAQMEYQIRQLIGKYYDAWLVCDDTSCGNRTRQMSVYGKKCLGPKGLAKDCRGVMRYEYNDKMMYNQLLYFASLFDVDKASAKAKKEKNEDVEILAEHNRLRFGVVGNEVQKYLEKCGHQWVSMGSIFGFSVTG